MRLAGPQIEGDAGPAPVVDLDLDGDERLGLGLGVDPRLGAVALVLAADHLLRGDHPVGLHDLVLLRAQGLGVELRRRLHRDEAEQLQQMGDDHVPVGAGALVEAGAGADRERLGHVDLHVLDVVAVPERLVEAVGEAEREDVLHRLLAEEVVDPEDLGVVELGVEGLVERHRRIVVVAERLLEDHARLGAGQADRPEHRDDRAEGVRRHREVVQQPRVVADLAARLLDPLPQRLGAGVDLDVGDLVGEGLEALVGHLVLAELARAPRGRGRG